MVLKHVYYDEMNSYIYSVRNFFPYSTWLKWSEMLGTLLQEPGLKVQYKRTFFRAF